MPKLRLTRAGFSRAIATLSREETALALQAVIERRAGDVEMANVFKTRADAIRAIRDQLANARPRKYDRDIGEVEVEAEFVSHVRDAATIAPCGWRYAT